MDERLSWDKHIDSICSKVGAGPAGIGARKRVKPFVPLSTTKMLYNAIIYSLISIIGARYGIIAELTSKIGCKKTKIVNLFSSIKFSMATPHPILKKHFN